MKKIFLKEEQMLYIQNALREQQDVPSAVLGALENKKTYIPLNDLDFSRKLLIKGYNNAKEQFSDNISQVSPQQIASHLSKLMRLCTEKEKSIKPQLEKLCYNIVVELFNIPEDEVIFSLELVDTIDSNRQFHISPDTNEDYEYDSMDSINDENAEVEKRRIVDSLVVGASQYVFDKAKKYYINDLFDIDEELPYLYNKLIKLNQYALFSAVVDIDDNNHHQGGYAAVRLGNSSTMSKIEVKAVNFPILLMETIKGIMELVSAKGLPNDLSTAKNVVNKADTLEEEPWDMRLGYEMWKTVTLGTDMDTKIIPEFFENVVLLDAPDFIRLMSELSHNTKQGKECIRELINDCEYKRDYDDFEGNLLKKHDAKDIIEDGYFTEDELCGERLKL